MAVADDRSLIRESTMKHPASVSVKLPMPSTIRRHNHLLTDDEMEQCTLAINQDDPKKLEELLITSKTLTTVKSKSDADQVRENFIIFTDDRKKK